MTTVAAANLIKKTVLGRYRILRRLARGGMGAVYLGRTEGAAGFARPVVIKRVLPGLMDDEEVAQMFVREAQILSNLQHPNIVSVLDFGQQDDGAYLMVLEYVNGYQLAQWHDYVKQARGAMPADFAIYIVTRVLDALHYAHTFKRGDGKALQIIHRDVSPSNVLLTPQGDVKLLDFGIARVSGDEAAFLTDRTRVKGKLPYLPLEAFKGAEPSVQSDVYAAGVVLYELLTGANPFLGRETAEIYAKILDVVPKSVHAAREDAPEDIDAVLATAMNKDPAKRFASAADFAHALRPLRAENDEVVAERLTAQLRDDFEGAMPAALGLEPLAAREQTWRSPARDGDVDEDDAIDVAPISWNSDEPRPDQVTVRAPIARELIEATTSPSQRATRPESPPEDASPDTIVTARPAPIRSTPPLSPRRLALVAGLAAVFGAVAVLGAWVILQSSLQRPDEIVVIRQEPRAAAPAPRPAPRPPEPTAPAATLATPTNAGKEHIPAARDPQVAAPPNPKALTRIFGRRHKSVQACFDRHAANAPAQPQLSIHFWVDAAGKVTQTEVEPEALRATALARCLQDVARATSFGPLEHAVSFHIPITAEQL